MPAPPRYAPDRPLPPYAYVPGRQPHPVSDPRGHRFGLEEEHALPLDPRNWRASTAYLYGIDLFNHGYYWEAHEAWEALWIAAGRTGTTATVLKGLIKLAAAGVKAREGNAEGVRRHARRAAELIGQASADLDPERFCLGLDLARLVAFAQSLAAEPITDAEPHDGGKPVLPLRLTLDE